MTPLFLEVLSDGPEDDRLAEIERAYFSDEPRFPDDFDEPLYRDPYDVASEDG
jgi:hypothetical protein